LEPLGKGLLGTTLRFDYEVRSEKEYFSQIPSQRISKDMVSLASHILQSKAAKFEPGKFKDEYEMALRKLVQRADLASLLTEPLMAMQGSILRSFSSSTKACAS
jgi:DNA end-binding protein Ku